MTRPSVSVNAFVPGDSSRAADPMTHLTRVFVYFLQNLFREFPEGCGMRWSGLEETSEIIITNEKQTLEVLEKTPSITCVMGSGQMANTSLDQMQNMSFNQAWRKHTDLIPMTMAYHCQAKKGLEARRVAWNAGFYTNVLRRFLMRTGGLHHVSPNWTIGAESAATAYTGPLTQVELVSVVVTVPFYWQAQWLITEPAHLLRKIQVDLTVNRARVFQPPRWRGRLLRTVPIDTQEVAFTQTVLVTSTDGDEG